MKRIYDQPSHWCYGPCRRLWIMLYQLDMLQAADLACDGAWDLAFAKLITAGVEEKFAARTILYLTLKLLEGDH